MVIHSLARSSKFTYSSRKNPCPVCGRTKDSDCRWDTGGLCHCRTYAKTRLRRGEVVQGSDGQQWAYLGDSDGGRWALFRPHRERYDRKPKPASSAKRPTAPTKQTPKPASAPPTVAKKATRPAGQQEFIYRDADGHPTVKVLRTDYGNGNKKFYQLRYENGQWVSGLTEQASKRVRLYRIAEAREMARKTNLPIFLVEGESCVERLMALGIPATTSIGGARKWTGYGYPNYLEDLSNFRVVLCPDADVHGLDHMLEVEKSLRQHGINVAGWLLAPPDAPWNNLPEGGGLDIVDWLESGATAEEILDSIRVALPDYLAEDEATDLGTEENDTRNGKKKSVAKSLIELALGSCTLWHDSAGSGWVDFTVNGVLQTARIRSKRFRDFLSHVFWEREKRSVSSEAWTETVGTLEAKARFDGPEKKVFLRVGKHENCIYLDLGAEDWSVVRVSPDGWQIIPYSECPIRFYRTDCQLPLPTPTREGSLDDLWQLLNVREADRPLVLGWILSTLTPDGSKPILVFTGEKGSGKSSAATLLKRLTDPTAVSLLSTVGDPQTVAVTALHRWVICYDNLTHLSTEQHNLLCGMSTGGGYSRRTLYTDLEETFLQYRRPQILTGIDLVPTRSDLLDRCLIVRLERISEESRLTERELETLTADLLPGIYGALLDLLAVALRNLPTTKPAKLPRMTDFYELCLAAGIPGFEDAYMGNLEVGNQAAVEANPLAEGVLSLLEAHDGYWKGSATELIQELQKLDPTSREFQKLSASAVGKKLASSLKSDLKAVGVDVTQRRDGKQRTLVLSRVDEFEKTMPQTPQTPTPVQNNGAAVPSTPEEKNVPVAANANGTPPTSNTASEEDSHTSRWQWDRLLDACDRAGVPHWRFRDVVSEAAGISKKDVGNISLSQEQYQRVLRFLEDYQNQNGATAVPSAPEEKQTPARPVVAVTQPNNSSRLQRTSGNTAKQEVEDDRIFRWRWNGLFAACIKAGITELQVRAVLAEACGISQQEVDEAPLTSEQYRRALLFLASYKNGATANGSSPPSNSTQTGLPLSSSAHEGVSPWQWET